MTFSLSPEVKIAINSQKCPKLTTSVKQRCFILSDFDPWTHPKQSGMLQRPCSDNYNILHVVSDKWRTSTLCYFQIWWELQSEVVRGFGARQSSLGVVFMGCLVRSGWFLFYWQCCDVVFEPASEGIFTWGGFSWSLQLPLAKKKPPKLCFS